MKRLMLIGAALCVMGALAFSGTAIAGARTATPTHHLVLPDGIHSNAVAGSPVTVGSTWTLYNASVASFNGCEVLSFVTPKLFTGDDGDLGKWHSTATSTKITINPSLGNSESVNFKLSWVNDFGGYWDGNGTSSDGSVAGPYLLAQGDDPFGFGGC
jgi:hypothetical protein